MAHGRRFYIGLGTIASDLIILLVVTGIARGRFAARWPWAWRMIHATAYLCWPLAIIHGLLAGRAAKPYVDWSYGACVALVALALGIRFVATIRAKNDTIGAPVPDRASAAMAGALPALAMESFASQRAGLGGERTALRGRRAAIASERIGDVHTPRPARALPRAQRALPAGPSSRPADPGRSEGPPRTIAMSLHDEPDQSGVMDRSGVVDRPDGADRPTGPNRRPAPNRAGAANRSRAANRATRPNRAPAAGSPAAPYADGSHTGPITGPPHGDVPYAEQPQLDVSHPSGPHAMPPHLSGPHQIPSHASGSHQVPPHLSGPHQSATAPQRPPPDTVARQRLPSGAVLSGWPGRWVLPGRPLSRRQPGRGASRRSVLPRPSVSRDDLPG